MGSTGSGAFDRRAVLRLLARGLSHPWAIAFLPDGRMLITEKVGNVFLVTQAGEKTPVGGVPKVLVQGQGGLLGIYLSPHYATDHFVYLTYAEPLGSPGSA
mgnify:CR=1 FL=1